MMSGVALRQRGDEVVRIGGARRCGDLRRRRIRLAEPQIVLDRAVEQIRVLPHHGDLSARRVRIERGEVGAADAHAAGLRIVKPQQQRRDGRLAAAARADDADALAGSDVERQPTERLAAPARIGEMHVVETDGRRERRRGPRAALRHRRLRLQQRVDAERRRLPDHAVMQHGTEIAQRAENLGARHQHDEQRLQGHHAVGDTVGAERNRRRGADADADIDDAARDQVGGEHPHRRGRQFTRLAAKHPAVSRALAERLERRQTLDGVEKLGAETFQRGAVREADFLIAAG